MTTIPTAALFVALLSTSTVLFAAESSTPPPAMPPMPEPTKEHAWLQQFVGEWESEAELVMEPGQPPMQCKGTQSARMIGGFWVIEEGKGDFPGMGPVTTLLTIGYDVTKQKFVGTWIDSTNGFLWHYEGSLDPTGKMLVLESEGPSPAKPGTTVRFRDVTEFKSKDHRVLTSSVQGADGRWVQMMTAQYRLRK